MRGCSVRDVAGGRKSLRRGRREYIQVIHSLILGCPKVTKGIFHLIFLFKGEVFEQKSDIIKLLFHEYCSRNRLWIRKWREQIGGPLYSVTEGSKLKTRLAITLRDSHKHTF